MLDWTSAETLGAIRTLVEVTKGERPLLLWIGAGVSRWCGYPSWDELADQFHSKFSRERPRYDVANGLSLRLQSLPKYFGYCKSVNAQLYRRLLVETFGARPSSAVYNRFVGVLEQIRPPLRIFTTNVDEQLEKATTSAVVQRSDVERLIDLIAEGKPFLAKLHGSVSAVESLVFTQEDYEALASNHRWLEDIRQIVTQHSVVFFGYGLRDEHLLRVLNDANANRPLFGDGPHFAVLPKRVDSLPSSVRQIIYVPEPHQDHRSAIRVLEATRALAESTSGSVKVLASSKPESAHFITDLSPPGTWKSSNTFGFGSVGEKGTPYLAFIGHGIEDSEIPDRTSTAMHDLVVGLLCFDRVYIPLHAAHKVHNLVGSTLFHEIVNSNALQFIHWPLQEAVTFANEQPLRVGGLGSVNNLRLETAESVIREQIRAAPGMEAEAEKEIARMMTHTRVINDDDIPVVPHFVRSLLPYPEIRQLLGLGEGSPVDTVAPWMTFPVLRLAQVVRIGLTCNLLRIPSTKLLHGLSGLAGPAFSACSAEWWIDDVASYVVAGNFNVHLGLIFTRDPLNLRKLLLFRESEAGARLRSDILLLLGSNDALDVASAINGCLGGMLSKATLESARSHFAGLMLPRPETRVPSLWNNRMFDEEAMRRWKARSFQRFASHCSEMRLQKYDACPCGSGEKVKYCCEPALAGKSVSK